MNDTTGTTEKGAPREHEHDAACAFGSPTCPAFGEAAPPRVPWWRRALTRVIPSGSGRADG